MTVARRELQQAGIERERFDAQRLVEAGRPDLPILHGRPPILEMLAAEVKGRVKETLVYRLALIVHC